MSRFLKTLGAFALGLAILSAGHARADVIQYSITDIGTFPDYENFNISDTYTGQGFVGIYPYFPSFGHLFGAEYYSGVFSQTSMQVDISALAGKTVTSAILSYDLINGGSGSQGATITSFNANGTLGFSVSPPSDLGTVNFTSNGLSSNSVDVTSLVQGRVGNTWLGLFLTPNGPGDSYQWTYTFSGYGYNPDSANVRLTVTYSSATPEPSTFAIAGLGGVALVLYARRRRAQV